MLATAEDPTGNHPLNFRNAPRTTRDGGVFIATAVAMQLVDQLRNENRDLLDRLAKQ